MAKRLRCTACATDNALEIIHRIDLPELGVKCFPLYYDCRFCHARSPTAWLIASIESIRNAFVKESTRMVIEES